MAAKYSEPALSTNRWAGTRLFPIENVQIRKYKSINILNKYFKLHVECTFKYKMQGYFHIEYTLSPTIS